MGSSQLSAIPVPETLTLSLVSMGVIYTSCIHKHTHKHRDTNTHTQTHMRKSSLLLILKVKNKFNIPLNLLLVMCKYVHMKPGSVVLPAYVCVPHCLPGALRVQKRTSNSLMIMRLHASAGISN